MPTDPIHHTVHEFLQQMGFTQLNWQGENLVLAFEQLGTLHIEVIDQGLLVVLFKEFDDYHLNTVIPRALRLVHLDHNLPLTVQTGIKDNRQLAFITTLPPYRMTITDLIEALSVLDHLHQQLAA